MIADDPEQHAAGEREQTLTTAISDAMVKLHRDQFGRGPASAKTLLADHVIVVVLSDVYTPVERTLLRIGKEDTVRETRLAHQRAVEDEFVRPIEQLSDRRVESFASSVTFNPDQAIEIFLMAEDEPAPESDGG